MSPKLENLPERVNPSSLAPGGEPQSAHVGALREATFTVSHDGPSLDLKSIQVDPEVLAAFDKVMVQARDGETGAVHFQIGFEQFIDLHHFDLPRSDHAVDLVFTEEGQVISSVHLEAGHDEQEV